MNMNCEFYKENKDGRNKDGGTSGINKDKLENVINSSSGIGTRSGDSSRDRSNKKSPNKEEPWVCDACSVGFFDKNDMLLTREYCEKHRCVNCLGMTKAIYKAISGRTDLLWFCSNCIENPSLVLNKPNLLRKDVNNSLKNSKRKWKIEWIIYTKGL